MDKEPITVTGLKSLKSELEDLKNIQNEVRLNGSINSINFSKMV